MSIFFFNQFYNFYLIFSGLRLGLSHKTMMPFLVEKNESKTIKRKGLKNL